MPFPRDSFSRAVHAPKIREARAVTRTFLIALIFLLICKICSSEEVFSPRKENQCLSAISP